MLGDTYRRLFLISSSNTMALSVVSRKGEVFLTKEALNSLGESLILREVAVLRALQTIKGTVHLIEVSGSPRLTAIFRFYKSGDLEVNARRLGYETKLKISLDLVKSFKSIHRLNIVHNDLKPSNVLLDDNLNPAICDWTFADFLNSGQSIFKNMFIGTPDFLAPESFLGYYSKSSDLYSLAATIFWFLNLSLPFSGSDLKQLFKQKIAFKPPFGDSINKILMRYLAPEASDRPSIEPLQQALEKQFQKLAA